MEISTLDLKRACNCSPFFNWTANLDKDDIPRFCLRIDGTEQMFGPFGDQGEARQVWDRIASETRSICTARYTIVQEGAAG